MEDSFKEMFEKEVRHETTTTFKQFDDDAKRGAQDGSYGTLYSSDNNTMGLVNITSFNMVSYLNDTDSSEAKNYLTQIQDDDVFTQDEFLNFIRATFEHLETISDEKKRSEAKYRFGLLIRDYMDKLDEYDKEIESAKKMSAGLPEFIQNAYNKFEKYTKLSKEDDVWLITTTVMQTARQMLLNKLKNRLDDKEAAKKVKSGKERSNRSKEYYASIEEIYSNPVPFDTIQKEKDIWKTPDDPKLSGFNHRYKTLGHDPILGLIFGTANIMTNTLTLSNFKSYHVHTGLSFNGGPIDKIKEPALTGQIFANIYERFQSDKQEATKPCFCR